MSREDLAERLLEMIFITDMIDRDIKIHNDGKPTFCDNEDYRESKAILQKAAIRILRKAREDD